MKRFALLAALAVMGVGVASQAWAANDSMKLWYYLDDNGNVVGEATIPCTGGGIHLLWGIETSHRVLESEVSCTP